MTSTTDYKRIDVNEVGGVTVVRFRDEGIIEDDLIQEIGRELFQLVEVDGKTRVLLNFSGVNWMSSALLIGKLIPFLKKVGTCKGVLKLSNIRPEILEAFVITGLDQLFDIKNDETDALAAF
jgi:anti-sigma B factor antagonist